MSHINEWNENRERAGLPPLRFNPDTERYEADEWPPPIGAALQEEP